jgi:hypothetical protein
MPYTLLLLSISYSPCSVGVFAIANANTLKAMVNSPYTSTALIDADMATGTVVPAQSTGLSPKKER